MTSVGFDALLMSMIRKPGNVPWYASLPWNAMSELASDRLPAAGRAEKPTNRMLSVLSYSLGGVPLNQERLESTAWKSTPISGSWPENTPRLVSSGCADAPTGTASDTAKAAAMSHLVLIFPPPGG